MSVRVRVEVRIGVRVKSRVSKVQGLVQHQDQCERMRDNVSVKVRDSGRVRVFVMVRIKVK